MMLERIRKQREAIRLLVLVLFVTGAFLVYLSWTNSELKDIVYEMQHELHLKDSEMKLMQGHIERGFHIKNNNREVHP